MVEQQDIQQINDISYNQDQTHLALGTNLGFYIYSTDPFVQLHKINTTRGVKLIHILQNTGKVLIIYTQQDIIQEPNKITLYNYKELKEERQYSFIEQIYDIQSVHNMFIAIQALHVQCMGLDSNLIYVIDTLYNIRGLVAVSFDQSFCIAAPHVNVGSVVISWFTSSEESLISLIDNSPKKQINNKPSVFNQDLLEQFDNQQYSLQTIKYKSKIVIESNQSGVSQIAVTYKGDQVAITSITGTLIRIFDTRTSIMLKQYRRGIQPTQIYSLYFDIQANFIVCGSEKQTIHIYKLKSTNTTSYLKSLSSVLPLVDNEWSFAQFQLPAYNQSYKKKTLIKNQILYIFSANDARYMVQLTQNGGMLQQVQKTCLLTLS